jgi:hypothetical protein
MKKLMVASLLALPLFALCQEQASAFFSICGSSCNNYSFQIPRFVIGFDTGVNNACCPTACHPGGLNLPKGLPVGPAPAYPAGLAPLNSPPLPPISALSAPASVQPATYKTSAQPAAPSTSSARQEIVMEPAPTYWYSR